MTDVASRIAAYLDDSSEPLLTQQVPAALNIDTRLLEDGDHVLRIEAWNTQGCKGVKRVPFSVRNGPSISLRGLEPHNVVEGRLALTIHAFAGAREEDWEPAQAETPAPVPTWVWVILIGVLAWAMYYVVAFWNPNADRVDLSNGPNVALARSDNGRSERIQGIKRNDAPHEAQRLQPARPDIFGHKAR